MPSFQIVETANGEFVLRIERQTICRCFSYDDAIKAYEDYMLIQEARQHNRKGRTA